MGYIGKNECPDGYEEIYDESVCEIASYYLSLTYYEPYNRNNSNSICNWCGNCIPEVTRVSNNYGPGAKWICQKGMTH